MLTVVLGSGCAFAATETGARTRVVAVEGTQLILEGQTRAVFADVVFPDPALAQRWMAAHLLQQPITYREVGTDRYGRMLIDSEAENTMLREGVAIAYGSRPLSAEVRQAEEAARLARRGVWGDAAFFATPQSAATHLHRFVMVEGVITHIYRGRSATYLNFGEDWKTDFSVVIPGRARRAFAETLERLPEGSRVRVRGVVTEQNGPMIELIRPEQLERL